MALVAAALVLTAKILLGLLGIAVVVGVSLLVLPTKARIRGCLRLDGDFEELIEGGGTIGIGGQCCEDTPVTVTLAGEANVRVCGGAFGVDYSKEAGLQPVLLGMRFNALERRSPRSMKRVPAPAKKRGTGKHCGSRSGRSVRFSEIEAWFAPPVRKRFLTTVKSLLRSLHFRGLVHAEMGLPDPSVTGMAYAAFVTWSGATGEKWLTFKPNFVDDVVSIEVDGSTRLVGAQVAWIVVRFLLSRDIRPLWRKKRAGESKKAPVLGAQTTG